MKGIEYQIALKTPYKGKDFSSQIEQTIDVLVPGKYLENCWLNLINPKSDINQLHILLLIEINSLIKSYLVYWISHIESQLNAWIIIQTDKHPILNEEFSIVREKMESPEYEQVFNNNTTTSQNIKYKFKDDETFKHIFLNRPLWRKKILLRSVSREFILQTLNFKTQTNEYQDADDPRIKKDINEFFYHLETAIKLRNFITHYIFFLDENHWERVIDQEKIMEKNKLIDKTILSTKEKITIWFESVDFFLEKLGFANIQKMLSEKIRIELRKKFNPIINDDIIKIIKNDLPKVDFIYNKHTK